MIHCDVFNGNADGICALQLLSLSKPVDSVLVTGVKRDFGLLKRVDAAKEDRITEKHRKFNRTAKLTAEAVPS